MNARGFTNWLGMTRAEQQGPRSRSQRIQVPGDDSTRADLRIAIAIFLATLALFVSGALFGDNPWWRVMWASGSVLWILVLVDLVRRYRRTA